MISKRKSGFVVVLTMMILSATVLLVSLVVNRVAAYRSLSKLWNDREKARFVALGGVHIAMSQLSRLDFLKQNSLQKSDTDLESNNSEKIDQKEKKDEKNARNAVHVLLNMGLWQKLTFTVEKEGIDGACSINITPEEGKIPLSMLYDPKKKKWVQRGSYDAKKLLVILNEKLKSLWKEPFKNLDQPIEQFFKKEGVQLEDVSQILQAKELAFLPERNDVFISEEINKPAFNDIFTVASTIQGINPLIFSKGMLDILNIKKKSLRELEKPPIEEIIKIVRGGEVNWREAWNEVLKPLYSKDFKTIPDEITALFTSQFEANVFSVVSYGKVGTATQKVAVLIEKVKNTSALSSSPFIIRKLYWL